MAVGRQRQRDEIGMDAVEQILQFVVLMHGCIVPNKIDGTIIVRDGGLILGDCSDEFKKMISFDCLIVLQCAVGKAIRAAKCSHN